MRTLHIAHSEGAVSENGRLRQAPFRLPAFASDPDLSQIAAGSPFINEKLALLLGAIRGAVVRERIPINIPDVSSAASTHKSNRNNRSPVSIAVDIFPARESLSVN